MQWTELIDSVHHRLEQEIESTSTRGFHRTAMWLSEMLAGMIGPDAEPTRERLSVVLQWFPSDTPFARVPPRQSRVLLLARSAFQCGEYLRCYSLLQHHWKQEPSATISLEQFFCCYAWYLSLEQRDAQAVVREKDAQCSTDGVSEHQNSPRVGLAGRTEVADWSSLASTLESIPQPDAYIAYLQALVGQHLQTRPETIRDRLCAAVRANPFLWCAWEELVAHVDSVEDFNRLDIPQTPFTFHCAHALLKLNTEDMNGAKREYNALVDIFPNATYIRGQLARHAQILGDSNHAIELYESIAQLDEYRSSHFLEYSNVLCTSGRKDALGALVIQSYNIDQRGETTNTLIANYFSVVNQHTKAVEYLHRALSSAPKSVTLWVLLGHEYNHIGNAYGAIFAFSLGIQVAPKDYRCWYGLGCTYDALHVEDLAVHFLYKAAKRRPNDGRLWFKIAEFMEKHERFVESVDALHRSIGQNPETNAYIYLKMATITESQLHDVVRAIGYYEQFIATRNAETPGPSLRLICRKLGAYYAKVGFNRLEASTDNAEGSTAAFDSLRSAKYYIALYMTVFAKEADPSPDGGLSLEKELQMMQSVQRNVLRALGEE